MSEPPILANFSSNSNLYCDYCGECAELNRLFCNHNFCIECSELIESFLHRCPKCDVPLEFVHAESRAPLPYCNEAEEMLRSLEVYSMEQGPFFVEYERINEQISICDEGSKFAFVREFCNAQRKAVVHHLLAPIDYTYFPIEHSEENMFANEKAMNFGEFCLLENGEITTFDHPLQPFDNGDLNLADISSLIRVKEDSIDYCITDVISNGKPFFSISPIIYRDGDLIVNSQAERIIRDFEITEVIYPAHEIISKMQTVLDRYFQEAKNAVFKLTAKLDYYYRVFDVTLCLANHICFNPVFADLFKHIFQFCNVLYSCTFSQEVMNFKADLLHLAPVTTENFIPGAAVIRGHDWVYGNEDTSNSVIVVNGIKYCTGELVYLHPGREIALVLWKNGVLENYRVGYDGKHDLEYCFSDNFRPFINEQVMSSIEAFRKELQAENKRCICSQSAHFEFFSFNIPFKSKVALYMEILKEGELLEYFKQPNYDLFQDLGAEEAKCCLQHKDYTHCSFECQEEFWERVSEGRCFEPIRRCTYEEIHLTNERVARPNELKRYVNNFNTFMLQHVSIPLHAGDRRLRLPIAVTVGPDWHHGKNFGTKIGVLLPHMRVQNAGEVCVVWVSDLCMSSLYQRMMDSYIELFERGSFEEIERPEYGEFQGYTYDAGRENLFEICAYLHEVTLYNFKPGRLVAPTYAWELDTGQILGVLLWREGLWATVVWLDCSVNRHRIGCNGVYELTYVEYL